jgi:hypothetical protein
LLAAALLAAPPVPCHGKCWKPRPGLRWNYVLRTAPDLRVRAGMYDIDGFDTARRIVRRIHGKQRRAVCYLDAGTWERWRPDAGRFPKKVLGKGNGWPGERWVDTRRLDVLGPILKRRLDRCRRKGFDGVELDNVDGFANETGFPLTAADQLRFNRWLANQAHRRHLSAGLKNDLGQVRPLLRYFDFAVNEQCFLYGECNRLRPFIRAGKAVFNVEYRRQPRFCARAKALRFSSIRKGRSLGNRVHMCAHNAIRVARHGRRKVSIHERLPRSNRWSYSSAELRLRWKGELEGETQFPIRMEQRPGTHGPLRSPPAAPVLTGFLPGSVRAPPSAV